MLQFFCWFNVSANWNEPPFFGRAILNCSRGSRNHGNSYSANPSLKTRLLKNYNARLLTKFNHYCYAANDWNLVLFFGFFRAAHLVVLVGNVSCCRLIMKTNIAFQILVSAPCWCLDGYSCGGALIGLDQVVTAAHCVYNKPSEGHNKTIIDPANFIVKAGQPIHNLPKYPQHCSRNSPKSQSKITASF